MQEVGKKGFPLIGVIFLALGIVKLMQGDSWVIWIILGVLFGGLSVVSWLKDSQS